MATPSVFGLLLLGIFLSAALLEDHLTEAKRSRLYRMKRKPAPAVKPDEDTVIEGNCPPAPSAAHTKATCDGDEFLKTCSISCEPGYVFPGQTRHHKFAVECDESAGFWEADGEKAAVPDCRPTCPIGCKNGGTCSAPDTCTCPEGWGGKDCGEPVVVECQKIRVPANAGASGSGTAVGSRITAFCRPNHFFPGGAVKLTYECVRSSVGGHGVWEPIEGQGDGLPTGKFPPACIKALCKPDCLNGGTCIGPNVCKCPPGFRGPKCEFDCQCPTAPAKGNVKRLAEDGEVTCELTCNDGYIPSGGPMKIHCSEEGKWKPSAKFPTCDLIPTPPIPTPTTTNGPTPVPPPSDGFCYSYCQSSYRTFDNKRYEFNGKCRYVLAKDCQDGSFEIQVINDRLCDEGSDCRRSVVIKAGSATVILEKVASQVTITDETNSYTFNRLPATVQSMEIDEVGDMVEVTNDLGFTLRWDKEQFVSVEITKASLKAKMCGLCGNYDDRPDNDFAGEKNAISFGISNKVGNKDCVDGATKGYCDASKTAAAEAHCAKLTKGNFTECAGLVSTDGFMKACKEAVCRYGVDDDGNNNNNAACCAFEALVRECVRKGGKGAGAWRTEDFCPAGCPPGQIYDDCGPSYVKTCSNQKSQSTSTECVEGCRCPDGLLLHNGKCIPPSSCPCKDGQDEYEEGSSIKRDCNTCTCKGGSWDCTGLVCDAICEGNGDPHYRTFDGKNYDFMGDCKYYLVVNDDITIIVENRKCGIQMSCTKSLEIIVGGTDIKLLPGKAIQLGDDTPQRLIEFKNADVYYHPASSIWEQLNILGLGVTIQWDGVMAFRVIVPSTFIDKTKGLCGTFNHKQKDDFLTPQGDIETSPVDFGNKWRVIKDCKPIPPWKPCEPPKLTNSKRICKILKEDPFKKCHDYVPVEHDQINCVTDHCFCDKKDISDCICNDLRRYADACERKGHGVGDWRSKVKAEGIACPIECPPGEVHQKCVENCATTCRAVSLGKEDCKYFCTEGCTCPKGKVRDNDGKCIDITDCGCHYNGKDFGKGDKTNKKDEDGVTLECECVGPEWKCIRRPPPCVFPEKWTDCVMENCEETCSSNGNQICTPPEKCVGGCECADNYVKNAAGKCVLKADCECEHGGKVYPPGGTIKRDCESCTCESGKWKCDACECAGTCTAWGDSHYTTFDGLRYEFAGKCEYVLVASGSGVKPAYQISVKNVACGSSGVTCAKTVTFAVQVVSITGQSSVHKVVLTRDGGVKPSASNDVFEIRKVGLFYLIHAKELGINLLWDKGTLLYVKLDAVHRGKVGGLCGNFDDDDSNDFSPRDGGVAIAQAHKFADMWRVNPMCEKATEEPPSKCDTNEKETFAKEKCGVMKGPLFAACRALVKEDDYYDRCVHDTCACDFGGDCDCLCTAISVYAEACASQGSPVRWRSQELCPIQCPCQAENATSECPCYNPCIPLKMPVSCLNRFDKDDSDTCDQHNDQCVEGCFKGCPPPMIFDEETGKCVSEEICKYCGIKDGHFIKPGEAIEDPCCVCIGDGGGTKRKCYTDASVRISNIYASEADAQKHQVCQTGIIRGYVPEGNGAVRVECQCCPPMPPKPTCPPMYKAVIVTKKDRCSEYECVCDLKQCPPVSDKCPIIENSKECCPSNACPPDPIEGKEPCDDEIRDCKMVLIPDCNITCRRCEIKCKLCPKDPTPKCGECEELITIPKTGKCGGCCPKFKCVPRSCDVYPTKACDSCSTLKQGKDKCGCDLPPRCERNKCKAEPLPNVTSCQQLVEKKDECGCPIYEVIVRPCAVPPTIACKGSCDTVVTETDICGCKTPKCVPHVCPVYPTVSCDECHNLIQPEPDKCGCASQTGCVPKPCPTKKVPTCNDCEFLDEKDIGCGCKAPICKPIICTAYPPINCSSCNHLENIMTKCGCWEPKCVEDKCNTYPTPTCGVCEHVDHPGKDKCNCDKMPTCKKNPCPTSPPPKCNACQKPVEKITEPCGCKKWVCEDKKCPSYPPKNCTNCEKGSFVNDKCDCAKPICSVKPCKIYAVPQCNNCEFVDYPKKDECGCQPEPYCKTAPCPDYKVPVCNDCQKADFINDTCKCPKPICVIIPLPTPTPPTCGECETLKTYKDKCGGKHHACVNLTCDDNIQIPKCDPKCDILDETWTPCGCLTSAVCKRKPCTTISTPTCSECETLETNVTECSCKVPWCKRKECPNEPSPNCAECEVMETVSVGCGCNKQICKPKLCPTVQPPPCDKRCEDPVFPTDKCGCQTEPYCKRKICPTSPPPTCNACQILVEKMTEPCGCKKWFCEEKKCTSYPPKNCTNCEKGSIGNDKCGCPEPICSVKPCKIYKVPQCNDCEFVVYPKKDECGCQPEPYCKKNPCPILPLPNVTSCQKLVEHKDKCGCPIYKVIDRPCAVPPTIVCPGSCDTVVMEKDICGCKTPKCDPHVCPVYPTVSCDKCHNLIQPEPDKCGCASQTDCVPKPCPTIKVPTCNDCEFVDYPKKDECGCQPEPHCKKYSCQISPPPECNKCQSLNAVNDSCKCPSLTCKENPCETHVTPTCNDCEHLDHPGKDDCGCDKMRTCKRNTCPTVSTPTCTPCETLETKVGKCGCETPWCKRKECPHEPSPNCTECEVMETVSVGCGCNKQICKPKLCPTVQPPPCDKQCEDLVNPKDKCGCQTGPYCKKKTCPTQAPVSCDPVCEELITERNDCLCPYGKCVQKLCAEPVMPECGPCDKVVNKTDQCGCLKLECEKRPCTTPEPPTCSMCDHLVPKKDSCDCGYNKCEKRPCPTQAPITCDSCSEVETKQDNCQCSYPECKPKPCPTRVIPECGACERLVNETGPCGCIQDKCERRPCPAVTIAPCGECERRVEIVGECGCKTYKCDPIPHAKECIINGIRHPIGSKWPNPFDKKCSKCECVAGNKCLGAKIECEPFQTKDCVVFCDEGEWYYPPTKEQCDKTCGPCCGECKKPVCNAKSGLVAADKTIEILKITKTHKRGIMSCTNKEKIHGLTRCRGACGVAETAAWQPNKPDSTCKCCKPTTTETISVRLTCEDGTHVTQPIKNPVDCACTPCDVDKGGRK